MVSTGASSSAIDPDTKSATEILKAQLSAWGLSSLTNTALDLYKEGLTGDAITVRLASTSQYKQRFAGNEARVKKGLQALTPAQYVAAENSYRQTLQSYGLPATFYDSTDDYRKFIENDVSADEVKSRAAVAQQVWLSTDAQTKQVWKDWYGLSDGAAIASILDPKKALPIVQTMAEAAKAGGAAVRNGLTANKTRITSYIDQGITADKLDQGFSDIGTVHDTDASIAARFGTTFDQKAEEQSRIQGLASARRKQQELYEQESALFSQRSAADASSLNRRTTGSF